MKQNLRNDIINWTVASVIVANSLCWILPFQKSALAIVMLASLLCLLLLNGKPMFSIKVIAISFFCLFFFAEGLLYTAHDNPFLEKYFFEFVILGIGGMMVAQTSFSCVQVIQKIGYLSIFVLPFLMTMNFTINEETDYGVWMGISYGCVKYVIALLFLVLLIKHERNITRLLFCASLVVYISIFLMMASRGAVLAVIISMLLFYMIKQGYKLSRVMFVVLIIITSFALFWDSILLLVIDLLKSLDIHFYAIEKIALKSAVQDLSNGRASIIEDALKYFNEAPVLGQGVAIYERFNERYVHNVFIQVLLEGGICLFIVIAWIIIKAVLLLFDKSLSIDQRYFLASLIGFGLIELLFSNYLWRSQCFWFLISYTMRFRVSPLSVLNIKK